MYSRFSYGCRFHGLIRYAPYYNYMLYRYEKYIYVTEYLIYIRVIFKKESITYTTKGALYRKRGVA